MRPDKEYEVDKDDVPYIRARPIWISADENIENIQNEIHVNTDGQKSVNTVGRSMKRDIQIKLKAVSADHCNIQYEARKGWTISERGKEKCSSNGSYIFLKSQQQMKDHMPSDLIPIQNDMIISFVNYEVRVKLEAKSEAEISGQHADNATFFADQANAVNDIVKNSGFTPVAASAAPDNSAAIAAAQEEERLRQEAHAQQAAADQAEAERKAEEEKAAADAATAAAANAAAAD